MCWASFLNFPHLHFSLQLKAPGAGAWEGALAAKPVSAPSPCPAGNAGVGQDACASLPAPFNPPTLGRDRRVTRTRRPLSTSACNGPCMVSGCPFGDPPPLFIPKQGDQELTGDPQHPLQVPRPAASHKLPVCRTGGKRPGKGEAPSEPLDIRGLPQSRPLLTLFFLHWPLQRTAPRSPQLNWLRSMPGCRLCRSTWTASTPTCDPLQGHTPSPCVLRGSQWWCGTSVPQINPCVAPECVLLGMGAGVVSPGGTQCWGWAHQGHHKRVIVLVLGDM